MEFPVVDLTEVGHNESTSVPEEHFKLFEILVPRVRNNGKPYRTKHHRAWDKQVIKITGGLTVFRPTTAGYWVSGQGDLYTDSMIPVRIVATDSQMDEIILRTLKHYSDQLSILTYVISNEVIITDRV